MTLQDKQRICARLFFFDNPDDYNNFDEAFKEISDPANNVVESFLDFTISPYIHRAQGYRLMMRDDGHVIAFRSLDGYVEFRTHFNQEEADSLMAETQKFAHENPQIESGVLVFMKCGWRLL